MIYKNILLLFLASLFFFNVFSQTTWVKVDDGTEFSVALKSDSSLWAWGNNGNGQLGINNTTTQLTPVQIVTDTDWEIPKMSSTTKKNTFV